MTHSTIRLWDHDFRFIATEDIPDTAINDRGEHVEIAIPEAERSPVRLAILQAQHHAGYLPNLHITIDDETGRRGGIIREISFHAGTLVLLIHVHSRTPQPETIYPPSGYGIGLPGSGNNDHAIIGCWATEDEARAAIATMHIYALGGAQPTWDTGR